LILHLALFLGTGSPACSTTLRSQNPVYAITAKAVAIIKQFSGFGPSMSLSAILSLVGIMLWISVGVWDFLALELQGATMKLKCLPYKLYGSQSLLIKWLFIGN
jgi:hypothetical protein